MWSMANVTFFETVSIWSVLGIAIMGLGYAFLLRAQIMRHDKGTQQMQDIWNAIRTGADTYLNRQLKTILPLIILLTGVLFFSVYIIPPTEEAMLRFQGLSPDRVRFIVGIGRAGVFPSL